MCVYIYTHIYICIYVCAKEITDLNPKYAKHIFRCVKLGVKKAINQGLYSPTYTLLMWRAHAGTHVRTHTNTQNEHFISRNINAP